MITEERELIDQVIKTRFFTKDAILEKQQSHCPVVNAIKFDPAWEFRHKGYKYKLIHPNTHFYKTTEMRYEWFKNTKPKFDIDSVYNLVSRQIIYPVLFFVDGKFQRWSKIDIIPDINNTTYIVINDIKEKRYSLQTVYIPLNTVLYMENPTNEEVKTIKEASDFVFCFDKDGVFIPERSNTEVSTILGLYKYQDVLVDGSTNIYSHTCENDANEFYVVDRNVLKNEYIGTTAHIAFGPDNRFIEDFDTKLDYVGDNSYKLNWISPGEIGQIFTFVWTKGNNFITDMTLRLETKNGFGVQEYYANNGEKIEYFNMDWNWFQNNAKVNIERAVKNILEYDQSILNDAYLSKSKVFVEEFTVEEFINLNCRPNNRNCVISKMKNGMLNNEIMLFIDGDLYEGHSIIDNSTNEFIIPMDKYRNYPTSDVELVYFTDIQNGVYDITIPSKGSEIYIPEDINPDYMQLFYHLNENKGVCIYDKPRIFSEISMNERREIGILYKGDEVLYIDNTTDEYIRIYDIKSGVTGYIRSEYIRKLEYDDYTNYFDPEYKIDPDSSSCLPVDFTLEHIDGNRYKINLTNESLYGKSFKLVSRRQFRHNRKVWGLEESDYHIYLDNNFNYISDNEAFLVFINNRKVNRENYIVTIPSESRAFTRPILELTTFLDKGDTVDIFYLPQSIRSISLGNSKDIKPLSFLIDNDDKNFAYNLSKDLQFFFVNGKKISRKYVHDVSAEHVVISKATSIYNLNIVYYIEGFKLVNEIYKTISKPEYIRSIMMEVFKAEDPSLDDNKLITKLGKTMLKNIPNITLENMEENFLKYHADIKSLINNVIMEYYVDYGLTTNRAFVFDVGVDYLDKFDQRTNYKYVIDSNGYHIFKDGTPTDSDDVYRIDLFTADGLLKYDIRNDQFKDQTIPNYYN